MNDPHVEVLHYRFVSEDPTNRFDNATPLTETLGSFDIELIDNILLARPREHYEDEESAKADFESLLGSWETIAFLEHGFRIRFIFERAEIIDREPTPDVSVLHIQSVRHELRVENITLTQDLDKYPSPDKMFQSTSLTDELTAEIKKYQDGRSSLAHFGNLVRTILEKEYGGRKGVRESLNVSVNVLRRLGGLCDTSDPEFRRKADGSGKPLLTEIDQQWIVNCVSRLTRRVGEVEVTEAKKLPEINVNNLY